MVLSRDPHAMAERAAEVLGTMRGLAAKIGQMASYVDGFVPEQGAAAFEGALAKLRAAAPTSSSEAIVAVVEEELGAPLDTLFSTFERKPFASASIGQVHRAVVKGGADDGLEVAVKVQHPGIDRAIASDLDNASVIEGLVGRMGARDRMDSARILREIRERFEEELDYRKEASQQAFFAELANSHEGARVPRVVTERSGKRVLTTQLVSGLGLDEVAAAPEADRARWARTLWAFTFDSVLTHGRFNADPHPGNFLFGEDGRVTFLDFGCVQPLPDEHRTHARAMHRAAIARDEEAYRVASRLMLRTKGGEYERAVVDYARRCFEPLFASPFRMTRPYVAEVVQKIQEMKQVTMFSKDDSAVPLPPGMVLMNRLQFGFYSVLARLDVEIDYAAIEAPILARLP